MRILFVSTELAPYTAGGAATLIAEMGQRLTDGGHHVEYLVVGEGPAVDVSPPEVIWVRPPPGPESSHLTISQLAAEALADFETYPDLIEFQDFGGLGFWSLMRRQELGLGRTRLAVRMHGPLDLIYETMELAPPGDEAMRLMERHAYAMADAVLVPSEPMGQVVIERYGVELHRVVVSEPPVRPLPGPPWEDDPGGRTIVSFGRLGEVKGSADFLDAALTVRRQLPDARFRFLGEDGWDTRTGRLMSQALAARIPASDRPFIEIAGPVSLAEVGSQLARARAVVFPSRFESFCLSAHETRLLGAPIVVPDLPAFRPYFSTETGALVYDGSIAGLAEAMVRLLTDHDLAGELAAAPPPSYSDGTEAYADLAPIRHPRAQAGLATTAHKEVEAALTGPPPLESRRHRLVLEMLKRLPEPAAAWLEGRLPEGHPYRSVDVWQKWRQEREPHRRLRARIREGEFPPVADPRVTVVIPCFNQGDYVEDAIRSVFDQTYESWEIVVVDDGSTDAATSKLLRRLRYPRTRVIRQANAGLSAARNAGMALAEGALLVPLDADDELEPRFLEKMVVALDSHPQAAMAHCWPRLFGDQNLIWINRPYNPYQLLLSNSLVGCVVMRAEAWSQVGGYDPGMRRGNEDWDLWLRFLEAGWGQVEVPEPLFRYRKHGVSMSVTTEARFEDARYELALAHPVLYQPAAVATRKAEWYPWVSVIVAGEDRLDHLDGQTMNDLEIVSLGSTGGGLRRLARLRDWPIRSGGDSLESCVATARGKFVVEWESLQDEGVGALEELVNGLEMAEDCHAAGPGHEVLWRRWALLDPECPLRNVAELGGGRPSGLSRGMAPDPRWDSSGDGQYSLPVRRVRPETEGGFPAWLP
jgi:glycosyltransferase involved in cell wall biosynthesis